ncbi:MAG: pitrilysin family protein [Gemmataceae bacterium]
MMAVAYEWHNYGKSTIGNRSDIENVPIDRLQAFYKKYYQPDNMMLVIAGKFDSAKALKLYQQHFGAIAKPSRKLDKTYTDEPAQDGERTVTLRRVGKVSVVGAMYHIPAAAHEDHAPVEVLSYILGLSPSGRLYKALVETKKATSVSANTMEWHDPSVMELEVNVAKGVKAEEVRDLMLDVAESFGKMPATAEEVERAKKKYASDRERALAKSQRIAIELSEWAGAGDWRLLFVYRDRIAKVTADDVNRVAARYIKMSNRTVGMFIPTDDVARTPIPETPDVVSLVKDYKGTKTVAQGETFDTSPENIEKRTQRSTLPSGLKVALLPKKTRGEANIGEIILRFGNEKSLTGHQSASSFIGPMLLRGTKNMTRQQIQDKLDAIGATLNIGSGAGNITLTWQAKKGTLDQLLGIVKEVLREPAFPQKEFDIIMRNSRQAIEKAMVDEKSLASQTLRRKLAPFEKDNIRYVPTFPEALERLDKVTLEEVVKLYKEQVGGTTGEIVLVGDFEQGEALASLEKIFKDWKSDIAYERIATDANVNVKGSRDTIQVPDKEGAIFIAAVATQLRDDDPQYAAAVLGNYILGGSGFTSRLMDRLRQKEGWCYGAGSQLRISSQDKSTTFLSFAICNPKNIDNVDKGTAEEIAKILKDGISEDELKTAIKGWLEESKVDRGKDGHLMSELIDNLHLKRTYQWQADIDKKVAELKVSDVNQALARVVQPDRLVIVRAGDFREKK